MRKFLKKIKSRSGETIAETLVALLISSLALVMLAGAISTSTGIIKRSSDKIDKYFKNANDQLVEMESAGSKNAVVKMKDSSGRDLFDLKIKYGENSDLSKKKAVISFKLDKE